jgi:hypothetical protein
VLDFIISDTKTTFILLLKSSQSLCTIGVFLSDYKYYKANAFTFSMFCVLKSWLIPLGIPVWLGSFIHAYQSTAFFISSALSGKFFVTKSS